MCLASRQTQILFHTFHTFDFVHTYLVQVFSVFVLYFLLSGWQLLRINTRVFVNDTDKAIVISCVSEESALLYVAWPLVIYVTLQPLVGIS